MKVRSYFPFCLRTLMCQHWSKSLSPYHGLCAGPCDGSAIPSLPSSPSVLTHSASAPGVSSQSLPYIRMSVLCCLYIVFPPPGIVFSQVLACLVLISFKCSNVSDSMRPSLKSLYNIASRIPACLMALLCFIFLPRSHHFLAYCIIWDTSILRIVLHLNVAQ